MGGESGFFNLAALVADYEVMTQKHLLLALTAFALSTFGSVASAQIDRPGNHINYSAEIEPHLVFQWQDDFWCGDEGIGLGLRASIPVMDDGPVPKINNSLAIGFGLDWAHFGDECRPGWRGGPGYYDYEGNAFWVPIVVQWNFYFSDVISAFPELGLGIEHSVWSWGDGFCGPGAPADCDYDESDTDVHPVFWLGVRFHLSDSVALTLRLGTPSLLLGASFFL